MRRACAIVAFVTGLWQGLAAQGPPGPPVPTPPKSGREGALVDFTGTWVSPVMEDYRWRMVTPLKGDAASIPYRQDAVAIINAWNPAKDEAAGLQCKAYGAPALLRIPGRLRISWQDDNTLKIEADQGTQTRLLWFTSGATRAGAARGVSAVALAKADVKPTWQGQSIARWEAGQAPTAGGFALGTSARWGSRSQSLEVVTTNLRDGYLRKNGVPYSDKTTLTEYFDRFSEPDGQEWFTVTTIVNDPVHLATPFVTTTDFRREPNDAKFSPVPCSAR
ncbi:MAG TPA: hypothetical protein VGQ37_15195 [Vicinamibacterales bacterium]|jgi:hypothetical protein|nr:hypothetical protein [Vicinamibacterales bacterium]